MKISSLQNLPPEVASNLKLEVTGTDLLTFAGEVATRTAQEVREAIKAENKPDELLTRQQVADMLGVTLTTLFHWNNKGILPTIKIGNKVRYRMSDIESLLNQKKGTK